MKSFLAAVVSARYIISGLWPLQVKKKLSCRRFVKLLSVKGDTALKVQEPIPIVADLHIDVSRRAVAYYLFAVSIFIFSPLVNNQAKSKKNIFFVVLQNSKVD